MPQGEKQVLTTTFHRYSRYRKYLLTIMQYFGEIFVIILFAFTSYASLQKGALRVQFQSTAVPLLHSNATVREFFDGDIAVPFFAVLQSDVSLVMYYAPWDFDSQLAIHEFERIANKYEGQIFCASINCWVHSGSCKKTFSKLRSFPLILGYVGASRGVHYNGPLQYDYIDKFVQSLITPLIRIETVADLNILLIQSSVVVTGFFNFDLAKPKGFYTFYRAALKYLEYDSRKTVVFAVITNPSAAQRLGINLSMPRQFDLRLHLWNETLIYPYNDNAIDTSQLLQWIHHRSHSPMQFISPIGRKNQMIQRHLSEQQPSLILFTSSSRPSYQTMVKEVAFNYYNCVSSPRIIRLIQESEIHRDAIESSRLELERQCGISENRKCLSYNMSVNSHQSNDDDIGVEEKCEFSYEPVLPKLEGLGCRTNRTLNFFVIDSHQHPNLLRNLGYSSKRIHQSSHVVFVVDPKAESYYVMTLPLTTQNLQNFVINYTENRLRRFHRSRQKTEKRKSCHDGRVCVEEISADDFAPIVLDPLHDAVVLFKKKGCVFCEIGARFFLKLSQMFFSRKSFILNENHVRQIKFVTIDAEENVLPWQYTVDKFPTIIFYPAHRKHDSRIYPHNLELNEANLLNFTLSQLSLKHRIIWLTRFCQDTACLQEAQRQIDAQVIVIDRNIRRSRNHLLWPENSDRMSVAKIQNYMKERNFFQELGYSVRKAVVDIPGGNKPEEYRDGIVLLA
ncbi:thioredoxin domain-containing protein 11-like isoform X2 [Daphnia carinata]|uniref:thioredoxin domain-containing protein 11-like isoform X2 n=1 Tax=Daphnia carinata TaxID=120202 RepID=UPI002868F33C|nr:thioredoxin domain-containing protein 11-like isoform X2 [Daphnia carinata]